MARHSVTATAVAVCSLSSSLSNRSNIDSSSSVHCLLDYSLYDADCTACLYSWQLMPDLDASADGLHVSRLGAQNVRAHATVWKLAQRSGCGDACLCLV